MRSSVMPKALCFSAIALFGARLCLAVQAPGAAPPPTTPPVGATAPAARSISVQDDIPYTVRNGQPLLLDVYQPAGPATGPRPAVVLIHGGGWTSLDKSTMRGMAHLLARSGFTAFSVDYRLLQGAENRSPAQLDDVQRAVRWVRANASKYAVNPGRIGAFGHSAGGQLAALLGMEETRDNSDPSLAEYSSQVQAVVDVSGPTDFTSQRDADGDAFLANFFGTDYAKDPAPWRDASPVFHVSKASAPVLIVHGTRDDQVPIAQSEELLEHLQQAGVPAALIKLDDGHTFKTPEARMRLAMETVGFFNRYLNTAP
jgi:acetyl esterase/lipase